MEDVQILDAVERYISGAMSADERVYFEGLRKTNPEIDQLVVEHTFFLQQLNRFDDVRRFKSALNDTHVDLTEKGYINAAKLKGRAKVVYMFNRYKRTAAIAASIAGITALAFSAMVWSVSPEKRVINNEVIQLRRTINDINDKVEKIDQKSDRIQQQVTTAASKANTPDIAYTTGGTGFLVDLKGYVVTSAHVVEGAHDVAVQKGNGTDYNAKVVWTDTQRDIAILKIVDTSFKSPASIPYSIRKSQSDIAEPIFTLGYPRNDIVYGEGYLAAKTGKDGDTLSVQISINANPGNSGSPVINRNGEIIGVLNARQTSVEGAVFAVQSKYIYEALSGLQKKDTAYQNIKLPTSPSKGGDRTQQVKRISDYVYMVKVK